MAKKPAVKAPAKSKKRAGVGLTIRCTEAWRKWVEDGAEHCRTNTSQLIDVALIDYLKARGFDAPAPKR